MEYEKKTRAYYIQKSLLLLSILMILSYIMILQLNPYQSIYVDYEDGSEYKIRTYKFLRYSELVVYRREPFIKIFSIWRKYSFYDPNTNYNDYLDANLYSPPVRRLPSDDEMVRYLIFGTECEFPPIE